MGNASMLENGRAKFAYDCAEKGAEIENKLVQIHYKSGEKPTKDDKYKSYVGKIPMMIKTNGVGATFAFVSSKRQKDNSKPKNAYDLIYKQTEEWLKADPKKIASIGANEDLCLYLTRIDSPEYRAVTIEILAFTGWLKRFADGLCEDKVSKEKKDV